MSESQQSTDSGSASTSQRVTIRLPTDLHARLETLVEDGQFFHTSAAIRAALRRFLDVPAVQARSLDRYLVRQVADQPDNTFDFTPTEVADTLDVSTKQLSQAMQAHHELADPLVALEQWPDDTHHRALWRATPRLSLTIPPGATHAPAGGDS
jgi:Arc/MetJ-type ribon-helix-helix transcriptional regulator